VERKCALSSLSIFPSPLARPRGVVEKIITAETDVRVARSSFVRGSIERLFFRAQVYTLLFFLVGFSESTTSKAITASSPVFGVTRFIIGPSESTFITYCIATIMSSACACSTASSTTRIPVIDVGPYLDGSDKQGKRRNNVDRRTTRAYIYICIQQEVSRSATYIYIQQSLPSSCLSLSLSHARIAHRVFIYCCIITIERTDSLHAIYLQASRNVSTRRVEKSDSFW